MLILIAHSSYYVLFWYPWSWPLWCQLAFKKHNSAVSCPNLVWRPFWSHADEPLSCACMVQCHPEAVLSHWLSCACPGLGGNMGPVLISVIHWKIPGMWQLSLLLFCKKTSCCSVAGENSANQGCSVFFNEFLVWTGPTVLTLVFAAVCKLPSEGWNQYLVQKSKQASQWICGWHKLMGEEELGNGVLLWTGWWLGQPGCPA